MSVTIKLDQQIQHLSDRFDDVRKYHLDPKGPPFPKQQEQITEWLTSISKDITVVSGIRAELNASSVTVSPPSPDDIKQLQNALASLSKPIQQNQAFNNFIQAVTAVLGAADTIASAGSKK